MFTSNEPAFAEEKPGDSLPSLPRPPIESLPSQFLRHLSLILCPQRFGLPALRSVVSSPLLFAQQRLPLLHRRSSPPNPPRPNVTLLRPYHLCNQFYIASNCFQ